MQIKKGKNRIALIFPSLEIAVKIPIIRFFLAARPFFRYAFRAEHRGVLRGFILRPTDTPAVASLRSFLFKGIQENWAEFLFFQKTKNPFLQPTYYSFFGLLNFQACGEDHPLPGKFFHKLYVLTRGKIYEDPHHFANERNFCFYQGSLRMIDYGSRRSHGVIELYGAKIVEHFRKNRS